MVVTGFGQSNSPGNEQREYWHSSSADNPGSRNLMGLKDPAVDALVEGLVQADSRESLITHTHALDRALRSLHLLVPNWYTSVYRVAYWNKFGHPATPPKYDLGLFTWWVDPDKEARLRGALGTQQDDGAGQQQGDQPAGAE